MTDSGAEIQFVFRSPPITVDTVHDFLLTIWRDNPDISELDRMSFETAIIELASNVIQHADTGEGVSCVLTVRTDDDQLTAQLSDTSTATMELAERPMPDELAESGRGLAFVRMLVDDLAYSHVGDLNVWRIVKKRQDPESIDTRRQGSTEG